jgi:hypothetical protein
VLRREAFNFGQVEAEAPPRACACSGQIRAPYRVKRAFSSVKPGPTQRSGRVFTPAESWPRAASNGLFFGQIRTDAALQACVCSGRIVASCRVKRSFPSVKSGPTQRSRRAFTPAELWPRAASSGLFLPSNQDRRSAPGVRLLRPNRGLVPRQAVFSFGQIRTDTTLQACVYSGRIVASCRVKRSFPSITMISDRLGPCAPKAIRAQAVTYPAEGHLEDYASLKG